MKNEHQIIDTNCSGEFNVLIGVGCESTHNHCVLIGSNLKSSCDYELIIGNEKITVSKILTEKEWREFYLMIRQAFGL